jgi:hypothetical protein
MTRELSLLAPPPLKASAKSGVSHRQLHRPQQLDASELRRE